MYFKHIFVLVSQKQEQIKHSNPLTSLQKDEKWRSFLLHLCSLKLILQSWKMGLKSLLNNFRTQQYLCQMSEKDLTKEIKIKMIERASIQSKQFDEPAIVNFLGVQSSEIDFYRSEIMRYQNVLDPSFQYLVNLFRKFDINKISVHNGINLFQTNVSTFEDHAEFYHRLVNSAVIESAKIDKISLDGEIALFNEKYWKNTDFNRITARYYGPTSLYDYDNLYFYCLQPLGDIQYQFQIKLQIKLFQKKILLQNVKRIKINFLRDKYFCFPTSQNSRFFKHFIQKNIPLNQNPQKIDRMVKFRPNKIENQLIQ